MEYSEGGPVLKILLIITKPPYPTSIRYELLTFPSGKTAFEHAIDTLQSAVPSAKTIYISLQDQSQLTQLRSSIDQITSKNNFDDEQDNDIPAITPIFNNQSIETGPRASLLAAHAIFPDCKWLVFTCHHPLSPPPAIQQLLLEYEPPVTCYMNGKGDLEPLLAIWDPAALKNLQEEANYGLERFIKGVGANLIRPLREEWIERVDTWEEWEVAMKFIVEGVRE